MQEVTGSIPVVSTTKNPQRLVEGFSKVRGVAQLVARDIWDVEAAGSNPVTPTKNAVLTAKEPQGSNTLRLFSYITYFDYVSRRTMRKPLYNIIIFIFHIITLVLLFTLCLHFEVINLNFLIFSKESIVSFFKNDYVVNIACTILTAVALYIIQIKYSKHKLKNDFRCNEIIHDVYDGIERTHNLIKESEKLADEIEEIKKDSNMDFNIRRKEEALKHLSFYKKHKADFDICNIALTYSNNWILIDSVQTVFFINLNFKLLNIVNNIKNRRPNLDEEYPKIKELFALYEEDGDDETLIQLGHEIHRFFVDIDFMSKYWFALLDYLGYDPMPIKLYIDLVKKEYPEYDENLSEFLKLPISQQNKISRKVQKKASRRYFKYRIQNFFK